MIRCWKCSETTLERPQCLPRGPVGTSRFRQRAVWGCLTAAVLFIIITTLVAFIIAGKLTLHPVPHVVQILAPDHPAALINQSALVDKHNNLVTYSMTSHANHTSTVLFDIEHGLICYKPAMGSCFLRQMETADYENMHILLNVAEQQVNQIWLVRNKTQTQTEFLGVLLGNQVDASTLQQPLQALCKQGHVYWTRKADGPKERLIYFCIDICFPSNICVSVCFYYLPE